MNQITQKDIDESLELVNEYADSLEELDKIIQDFDEDLISRSECEAKFLLLQDRQLRLREKICSRVSPLPPPLKITLCYEIERRNKNENPN